MSLHQDVPSGNSNDYKLTSLRRDEGTASVPGVFQEDPVGLGDTSKDENISKEWNPKPGGQREPRQAPELLFSVAAQGDLDEFGAPLTHSMSVAVAPEVTHLSRFADSYRFYTDTDFPSSAEVVAAPVALEPDALFARQDDCLSDPPACRAALCVCG